jgi:hypothetical protein
VTEIWKLATVHLQFRLTPDKRGNRKNGNQRAVLLTGHQHINEHPEQAPRTRQIAPLPRAILFIEEGRGIDTGADEYQSTMDALP